MKERARISPRKKLIAFGVLSVLNALFWYWITTTPQWGDTRDTSKIFESLIFGMGIGISVVYMNDILAWWKRMRRKE